MNAGVDIGYSAVKAISGDRHITFPSVDGSPDVARFSLDSYANEIVLDTPDGTYLVGQGAVEQSRFIHRREDRAWIESDEYYRLFLATLSELSAATSVDLVLVTGLPVAFYGDKETLVDVLKGEHRVIRVGRRSQVFRVIECRVIPQPFGALLAMALDDRGRTADEDLATGHVGVIDVGGKTTNLLSVNRLREMSKETVSVSVGAWDAVRTVRNYLADKCPGLELRDHQVIDAIITRQVSYYGEPVDLGSVVDAALEQMADQVIAEATHLWNGGANLSAVLVGGGGALLLGDWIRRHFHHARVVENPVFANALGYWKLAQRIGK